MAYWTQEVQRDKPSATPQNSSGTTSPASKKEWELRPLWQRLGLSVAQVLFGAAVGAFIMAARERAVSRIQLVKAIRPSTNAVSPNASARSTPQAPFPHPAAASSPPRSVAPRPSSSSLSVRDPLNSNWVELKTASGRVKQFPMKQAIVTKGRDATELILQIVGMRGHYWIGLSGAKILGKAEDSAGEGQGSKDDKATLTRDRFLAAWEGKPLPSRDNKWLSGPVVG